MPHITFSEKLAASARFAYIKFEPYTIIVSCFQTLLSTLPAMSYLLLLDRPIHALTAVYFVSVTDDHPNFFFCVYSACSVSLHWPNSSYS